MRFAVSVWWWYESCASCLLHRIEMLFIDYTQNFCWQKNMRHIYLPVWNFTCWIMCTNTLVRALPHKQWEREKGKKRERRNLSSHTSTVCIVRCCLYHGCPKQKRIETQMYKNLSTLSQTNQSKLCCRRCSTYRHAVLHFIHCDLILNCKFLVAYNCVWNVSAFCVSNMRVLLFRRVDIINVIYIYFFCLAFCFWQSFATCGFECSLLVSVIFLLVLLDRRILLKIPSLLALRWIPFAHESHE